MSNVGRIGAVLAAAAAAVAMTSIASPASAAPQGPKPVTNWVQAVRANVPTWTKIYYKTDQNICDVKIVVDGGRNVSVDYPGNHARSTSFNRDDSLRKGRTDYASVRLTARTMKPGIALLRATVWYDTCGWHARTMSKSTVLSVPVTRGVMPGNNNGPGGNNNGGHSNGDDDHNGHDQGHDQGHQMPHTA
jgi:hypothetical protein